MERKVLLSLREKTCEVPATEVIHRVKNGEKTYEIQGTDPDEYPEWIKNRLTFFSGSQHAEPESVQEEFPKAIIEPDSTVEVETIESVREQPEMATGLDDPDMQWSEGVVSFIEDRYDEFEATGNPYLAALRTFKREEESRNSHLMQDSMLEHMSKMEGGAEQFHLSIDEWYTFRNYFAYAIPNEEAIAVLVEHSPLVEIGAGKGYWASLVEDAGGDVSAYDKSPPDEQYTTIQEGGSEKIREHENATLFLSWPPMDDSMATDCLREYEGETFIYVGEQGEAMGDDEFRGRLATNWTLSESVAIPQFMMPHDRLVVYER